jgi:hypothetical protein
MRRAHPTVHLRPGQISEVTSTKWSGPGPIEFGRQLRDVRKSDAVTRRGKSAPGGCWARRGRNDGHSSKSWCWWLALKDELSGSETHRLRSLRGGVADETEQESIGGTNTTTGSRSRSFGYGSHEFFGRTMTFQVPTDARSVLPRRCLLAGNQSSFRRLALLRRPLIPALLPQETRRQTFASARRPDALPNAASPWSRSIPGVRRRAEPADAAPRRLSPAGEQ